MLQAPNRCKGIRFPKLCHCSCGRPVFGFDVVLNALRLHKATTRSCSPKLVASSSSWLWPHQHFESHEDVSSAAGRHRDWWGMWRTLHASDASGHRMRATPSHRNMFNHIIPSRSQTFQMKEANALRSAQTLHEVLSDNYVHDDEVTRSAARCLVVMCLSSSSEIKSVIGSPCLLPFENLQDTLSVLFPQSSHIAKVQAHVDAVLLACARLSVGQVA